MSFQEYLKLLVMNVRLIKGNYALICLNLFVYISQVSYDGTVSVRSHILK